MVDRAPFKRSDPWVWLPALSAIILALLVWLWQLNEPLFLFLNEAGKLIPETVWSSLTVLGDTLIAVLLVLPFAYRYPRLVWAMMIALVLGTLVVRTGKNLFDVARPPAILDLQQIHVIGPAHRRDSFPSGHSLTAFIMAALWVFLIARSLWLRLTLIILAALVGLSRVMVGVHWPVDVLVGAALGWLIGCASVALSWRWAWGMRDVPQTLFLILLLLSVIALAFHQTHYPLARWLQDVVIIVAGMSGSIQLYERFAMFLKGLQNS